MSGLDQDLDNLGPVPVVRRFVTELTTQRSVQSDRQGNYVSLRPAPIDSPIALYIYRDQIEIALDPHVAKPLAQSIPGASLRSHTRATTYVGVSASVLESHRGKALDLASRSLSWRADGVRRASRKRTDPGAPKVNACPVCHTEYTTTGTCNCD